MFTNSDYRTLSDIVFQDNYPGYRPNVVESPNGDGKWDNDKRYAHVAHKYLEEYKPEVDEMGQILDVYLNLANDRATDIAISLGVPKAFWPDVQYGALRILEYPQNAITNEHTDFDLFTLMCYRNIPEDFQYVGEVGTGLEAANKLNQQIHFGEILELIMPSAYQATPHKVVADPLFRAQYSIVYFSIPDHASVLPSGITVGGWIDERIERSRKEVA